MNTPTSPLAPGAAFDRGHVGRFVVRGVLGAGGTGVVLAAHDPDLDRPVAIKLLHPSLGDAAQLAREARITARLAHPNVVTVYEVGTCDDRLFLAMELVDGTTLRGWLAARPRTWREIVAMFIEAGRGLAAAHARGLVHRDFKPDNVLIGGDERPRVSDFGLAAVVGQPAGPPDDAMELQTLSVAGTPGYMSPEQWAGGPVDPRSDQFAFCVALWEAVHGERPFAGRQAGEVREAVCAGRLRPPARRVPRWLNRALRRGLAPDPPARWPDLASLLAQLRRGLRCRRWWTRRATLHPGRSVPT